MRILMNNTAPLVWMAQAAAQPSKIHSKSTAQVCNRRQLVFLDDTFRSRTTPYDQQDHWYAGAAPLLQAPWDTAL